MIFHIVQSAAKKLKSFMVTAQQNAIVAIIILELWNARNKIKKIKAAVFLERKRLMRYQDLRIGQEITIKVLKEDSMKSRANYEIKEYTITEKYPRMCVAVDKKGHKRGLSMGDLIMNGIIEQCAELEAIKKEPTSRTFRKGGI